MNSRLSVFRRTVPFPILACGLAALSISIATVADAEASPSTLERLGEYFERNPELKNRRGTGWNPYNRAKWFYEQRLVDGVPPAPGARWNVMLEKRAREQNSRVEPSATWFEVGPVNLSGRILDIEFDPANAANVYVGAASGGLWKSTDGGDTWITTTDDILSLAIGGIAVSPTNSNVVLIATGEGTFNVDRVGGIGILKSTDAGLSWNPTSLTYAVSSGTGFHFIEVNPLTGTYLAGANDGLWRSTDEGDTWTEVNGPASYFEAKWKPGANRVYTARGDAFGGTEVRVSTDDGVSWTTLSNGLPDPSGMGKSKFAVTPANPSFVYAHLTAGFSTDGIYRSTNDGATWSAQNTSLNIAGGQGWYNLTIACDPNDANRVIAGGIQNYLSTDGGVSFAETGDGFGLGTETALHWDHHAIAYEPGSNSNVWVGTDGGVWKSTDDGDTWASRREGIATYQFYDICVAQSDPAATLGGTQDNGVPGRVGVDTWFTSNLFADGMVCNVDPTDARVVYAESQFGNHVKSLDGGGSWFDIQDGINGSGAWVTPVDQDQTDPAKLFTESSNGIFRTRNGGASWSQVGTHSATWISISRVDGEVVWTVEGTGRPRVTTSGGGTWAQASGYGFSTGIATKIAAHPTDVNTAFVTFSGYGAGNSNIAMTTDLGASWTDVSGDLPKQPVNTMVADPQFPNEWYLGTDVGVWKTTNGGTNWLPFETGHPNAVVADLEIRNDARKLVSGTYGRGAWEVNITAPPTSADASLAGSPIHLMLDPPSPNPVTESTVLRFAAKYDGEVTLDVYDVRGRRVTPLAELTRGDGIVRTVPWFVDDLPGGVYFAVLRTGEDRISRKLVVAR